MSLQTKEVRRTCFQKLISTPSKLKEHQVMRVLLERLSVCKMKDIPTSQSWWNVIMPVLWAGVYWTSVVSIALCCQLLPLRCWIIYQERQKWCRQDILHPDGSCDANMKWWKEYHCGVGKGARNSSKDELQVSHEWQVMHGWECILESAKVAVVSDYILKPFSWK